MAIIAVSNCLAKSLTPAVDRLKATSDGYPNENTRDPGKSFGSES